MANRGSVTALKTGSIDTSVTTNGLGKNTGARVNTCLNDIVDTLTGSPVVSTGTPNAASVFASAAQGLLANSALQDVLTGNTVWVDAVNGDDDTGEVGRQDLPFETLTAAKNAASAGDLIHVRPGVYNEKNLLKNGVNWYFDAGAVVTNSDEDLVSIFDNTSIGVPGPVACAIYGRGSFRRDYLGDNTPDLVVGVVVCENPASNIYLSASDISGSTVDSTTWVVHCRDGRLTVVSDTITALDEAYLTAWENGTMYIKANALIGNYCVHSFGGDETEEHSFIDAEEIIAEGELAPATAIVSSATGSAKRTWVRAARIVGNIQVDSGLVYVTSQKIEGALVPQGGTTYITAQKYESMDNEMFGGTVWFDVDEMLTTGIFFNDGADMNMRVGQWTAEGTGLTQLSGSAKFTGRIVANSSGSVNPIVMSGGSLILGAGTVLIADPAADSITALTPQDVVSYGSYANTAVDGNVTVSGLLTVGSYVV